MDDFLAEASSFTWTCAFLVVIWAETCGRKSGDRNNSTTTGYRSKYCSHGYIMIVQVRILPPGGVVQGPILGGNCPVLIITDVSFSYKTDCQHGLERSLVRVAQV